MYDNNHQYVIPIGEIHKMNTYACNFNDKNTTQHTQTIWISEIAQCLDSRLIFLSICSSFNAKSIFWNFFLSFLQSRDFFKIFPLFIRVFLDFATFFLTEIRSSRLWTNSTLLFRVYFFPLAFASFWKHFWTLSLSLALSHFLLFRLSIIFSQFFPLHFTFVIIFLLFFASSFIFLLYPWFLSTFASICNSKWVERKKNPFEQMQNMNRIDVSLRRVHFM